MSECVGIMSIPPIVSWASQIGNGVAYRRMYRAPRFVKSQYKRPEQLLAMLNH